MGTDNFHKQVIDRLQKDFVAGSIDVDDIMFIGQRTRWIDKGKKDERIQIDQEKRIEELGEIAFDNSVKDTAT
eukprot:8767903-Prorocentrum_lima.AAC.1